MQVKDLPVVVWWRPYVYMCCMHLNTLYLGPSYGCKTENVHFVWL